MSLQYFSMKYFLLPRLYWPLAKNIKRFGIGCVVGLRPSSDVRNLAVFFVVFDAAPFGKSPKAIMMIYKLC